MKKIFVNFIFSPVVFSLFVLQSFASQNVQLTATADAIIDQYSSSINFGASNYIQTLPWAPSYTKQSVLFFDLSAIPLGATIINAQLKLTITDTYGQQRTVSIHEITNEWTENTVTWSNFNNAFDATVLNETTLTYNQSTQAVFDITQSVQNKVYRKSQNFGWLIKDKNEDDSQARWNFASKENVNASIRPVLEVEYQINDSITIHQGSLLDLMNTSTSFNDFTQKYYNPNSMFETVPTDWEYRRLHKWLWYWTTRVDSTGKFNVASEKMLEHLTSELSNPSASPESNPSPESEPNPSNLWESLGPTHAKGLLKGDGTEHTEGDIGRIECLWADPTDVNIILAASSTGGIWKTINGGENWICLTDHLPGMGAMDFAVNPSNTNIIYAVSGIHGNGVLETHYGYGVIKSTDGGQSWGILNTGIAPEDKVYMRKIIMHPTDYNKLYALAETKVYYTNNGGTTWEEIPTLNAIVGEQGFKDIGIDKNNPNIIYVGGPNAFYKSVDGGNTWVDLRNPNFNSTNFDLVFSLARDSIYVLYADNSYNPDGTNNRSLSKIMKSPSNSNIWQNVISNNVYYGIIGGSAGLEIEVSENGVMYAGGVKITKSVDNGKTFSVQSNIHADIRDIIFPNGVNDDVVFIAHDGGISKKDPFVNNRMVNINGDMAVNQFYSIGITEQDPEFMIGGAHDCGSLKRYTSGVWKRTKRNDGGTTVIDPLDANYVYAIFSGGGEGWFYRSTNAGDNFSYINGLISWTSSTPIYINPLNTNIVYTGFKKDPIKNAIKKSYDKGQSFPETIHGETENDWHSIMEMTGSPSNPDYIYFASYDLHLHDKSYLKRTIDGGETWSEKLTEDLKLTVPITGIYVHSTNPDKVWISVAGFSNGKKVFTSDDGGATWDNLSTNLPNIPVQSIIYDELYHRCIIGTDAGVYYKYDNEIDWQYYNNIPKTIIAELKLNRKNGDLVAATYGRGIWRTNIPGYCSLTTIPLIITTNTLWDINQTICSDVIVQNNSVLNVSSHTTMSSQAKITVKNGSTLIITDEGIITNANILIEDGAHLVIENNGVLELNSNDQLEIKEQAIFNYSLGEIKIISK